MNGNEPLLQSGGVELRLFDEADSATLFALVDRNRQHLRRWLAWVDHQQCVEDSREGIARGLRQWEERTGIVFGIHYRGKLVGVIGFNSIDEEDRKADIGYWLDQQHQGRGIVTTACKLLVGYGFSERDLHRIEIRCAEANEKSCAVAERLGFTLEGTLRESEWLYDHFVNQRVYALLQPAWHR